MPLPYGLEALSDSAEPIKFSYEESGKGVDCAINCVRCGHDCVIHLPWGELVSALQQAPVAGASYNIHGITYRGLACRRCQCPLPFLVSWRECEDWVRAAKRGGLLK